VLKNNRSLVFILFVVLAAVVLWSLVPAAEAPAPAPSAKPAKAPAAVSNDHIQVQHVLIGFKGSVRGKNITRSQEEAKALAADILARAKKGEDFGALVKKYTDDAFPGIYGMNNTGVAKNTGEYDRAGMVKAFGDTSFSLKPGEIGMADYDPQTSPFGWHIIKRLK
jgi:hypothetical protein